MIVAKFIHSEAYMTATTEYYLLKMQKLREE